MSDVPKADATAKETVQALATLRLPPRKMDKDVIALEIKLERPDIWEILENETPDQYAAFSRYCSMDVKNLDHVAILSFKQPPEVYAAFKERKEIPPNMIGCATIREWHEKFYWPTRYRAKKMRLIEIEQQAEMLARQQTGRLRVEAYQEATLWGLEIIRRLDPKELPVQELIKIAKRALEAITIGAAGLRIEEGKPSVITETRSFDGTKTIEDVIKAISDADSAVGDAIERKRIKSTVIDVIARELDGPTDSTEDSDDDQ